MRKYLQTAGLLVLVVTLLAGCAATKRNLATAHNTYQATMHTLTEYREAGHLSEETAEELEDVSAAALAALHEWDNAVARWVEAQKKGKVEKAQKYKRAMEVRRRAFWAAMAKVLQRKREVENDG